MGRGPSPARATSAWTSPGPEVLDGHRARRALAGQRDEHAVGAVRVQRAHARRLGGRRAGVLDGAVRPDLRRADAARRHRQLAERAVEVVAVEPGAGRVRVPDQQERGVGRPVGGHLARQVEVDLGLGVGVDVPDQQLLAAAALVQQQEPGVAGHGGEAERGEGLAGAVGLLGDRAPVGHPHHPDVRVAGVAVLGVADREQGLVLGEAADARVLGVGVDHLGGAVAAAHPDPGARVGRGARRDDRAPDVEARGVPVLDARERGLVVAARERFGDPVAVLVAVGVGEPPHQLAVGREGGGVGAAGSVGDAAVEVGRAVPDVDLGGAARVGGVEATVGGVARPAGPRHAGRGVARPPALLAFVVEEVLGHRGDRVCAHTVRSCPAPPADRAPAVGRGR